MKILMVSMPSLHFYRWVEQLEGSEHEIYWFDVVDGGEKISRINYVHQIVGWRRKYNFLGRYFVKTKFPGLYRIIRKFNEYDTATLFEEQIKKIKPDVVHSFALYVSCTPIIDVMKKYPLIKWIYSSWGSDLFYFQNNSNYLADIKRVLQRINYLFTDCARDFEIAKNYGFKGSFLGVFPGGGGYNLAKMNSFSTPLEMRHTIAIKGFQGRSGRAINVLDALRSLKQDLTNFRIIVFGVDQEVREYINENFLDNWDNLTCLPRISQDELFKILGTSIIYIGNSNSDGLPNTLLEAIVMGAFPIQSNPGGATEEVIINETNGLLLQDPKSSKDIADKILKALKDPKLIKDGIKYNDLYIKPGLERKNIENQVLNEYKLVEQELNS
ncbi:glycosyltransferase family 4 protein [Salegentibacter agarivorans]